MWNLRRLFAFWLPLEATWLMMAVEGPFLAAALARMPDPKPNLAAYGVAIALAMLVEAPIIMLMSAATALAADRESYRRLRNFGFALDGAISLLMIAAVAPPCFRALADLMNLPEEVWQRAWHACVWLLPWPAAIGYRRVYQGILIRQGSTRRVAYGTLIRLSTMALAAGVLGFTGLLHGAAVGAAALSAGVVAEAAASRWMARHAVAELLAREPSKPAPTYREIAEFYYPLALTSLLNMGIQPIVTFFAARGRLPVESLATLPVVNSLLFLFRTFGLAGQETFIAVASKQPRELPAVRSFAWLLAACSSGMLGLIAFTPAADLWLGRISGLPSGLASIALLPSQILVVMPAATVWMCWQRALLVSGRSTGAITIASLAEVGSVAAVMALGNMLGVVGIVSAAAGLVAGRVASNTMLVRSSRRGWNCLVSPQVTPLPSQG